MKKLSYFIIILILALIPIGVLASPLHPSGVTISHPVDYQSCSPVDVVTVGAVPSGYHVRYSVKFDDNVPAANGDLFGSSVVIPIPYPDSSTWNNDQVAVTVIVEIIQNGTQNVIERQKIQWIVTCGLPPDIRVTKTADPTQVFEPGGVVAFTVVVENLSSPSDPVTITSLVDSIYGDLDGQGTCSVPQTIQPGHSYTCAFTGTVSGSAGYSETDVVTASGTDDEGTPVSDDDDATVTVIEPPPAIVVDKTASPAVVTEPGGEVTFTVVVANQSSPSDPVTITSLVDTIHGNLNGQGTCSVPQTIQPGDSYTCAFTATVSGNAGDSETDVVTASGTDDEGTPVSDDDDAVVTVIGRINYFLPFSRTSQECGSLNAFGVTVGYEDLEVLGLNDFDYNDWVTDVNSILDFTAPPSCDLQRIDFTFTPQARGAVYDHAFHMLFAANTFASNGTATLTIADQNGVVLSSNVTAFNASVDNDFTIFAQTSDVFPIVANTREEAPAIPPARTAHLSIVFDTLAHFVVPGNSLDEPHGELLFFDPYLYVITTNDTVHRGDFRFLAVPVATYLWPEERRRIDTVYNGVQFVPGPPPMLNFVPHWWELPHNTCVYGDGLVCILPFLPGLK